MFRLVLLLTSIAALCGACGLKGDLYLPETSTPVVVTPSSSSSSSSTASQATP